MALRKHLAAKLVAAGAALASMLGIWALVRLDPPAPADAAPAAAATPATQRPAQTGRAQASKSRASQPVMPKRQTRTRAS